ncbi:ArsR/SmtB family transcription factor [Agrococcus sp. SGAir0287]|uniref:ArsR/SmtB family transcription factor n=1 Tax=Agrococcus sp. SGAir0287 TaxID=2070347 RepID=UPI0010CCF72B|nr:metalloregulator ArsR/SmtB family transcription factor [Agrococcus sp. SGAir0287]QCR18089.1 transcriptional regulator [Agrococcus sp. SGAir0287]
MNAFAILADPVRRRLVEALADGPQPAGALGAVAHAEFGITQPAVSNQLRALREAGVVDVEPQGAQRIYRLAPGGLAEVTAWVERYAALWPQRLDALETELRRGRRAARADAAGGSRPHAEEASA